MSKSTIRKAAVIAAITLALDLGAGAIALAVLPPASSAAQAPCTGSVAP